MTTTIGRSTPWHLWTIGGVSLLWNAFGAYDYVMTQTKNEAYMSSFSAEQLEYFYGFPVWFTAFWAIAVWGSVLGSILLLLRMKLAVPVLTAVFGAMAVCSIYSYGFSKGFNMMGVGGAIFSGVIFLIALLLVVYARNMAKRGVLR